MGVFKNEVGRPSNEVLKTRKTLKTILLTIVIILAFLGGYVVNNYVPTKDVDDKTQNNIKIESETKKQIDKNKAKKILENFVYGDYATMVSEHFSSDYQTILSIAKTEPQTKKYDCKELFDGNYEKTYDGDIIRVSGHLYCSNERSNKFYDYLSVKKAYEKLFGDYSIPEKEISSVDLSYFGYSMKKQGYVQLHLDAGDPGYAEENYIYESYELNNELHIIFTYFNYLMDLEYGYFDAGNSKDLELNISMDESYNIVGDVDKVFADNRGALPVYEIVFEKLNDNYIYRSLKQTK